MGNCCAGVPPKELQADIDNLSNELGEDEKQRDDEIGNYMKNEEINHNKIKKILLLGAGML